VHLADFNVASDLTPGKPLTSKSGTLAYLAPEVYAGRGYYSEPDWWSLGVLFYECIYNKRPFEANHHDALAQSIVKADPPFPVTSPAVSMPCLHAISSLLEKNKTLRIGAAGWETFTDNPFFRDINFEALERKEYEPVFCPSSEKTNFDATYDLEELLLEEAPLEARARKQKPRAELREDATQQEIRADELHRMIETMFEPFNYTIVPADRDPVPAVARDADPRANKRRATKSEKNSPKEASNTARPQTANPRPIPVSGSVTPGSASYTRSSTHSPDGSPPLPAAALDFPAAPTSAGPNDYFSPTQRLELKELPRNITAAPPVAGSANPQRPHGSTRSVSGGVQVVLDEQGSWSKMANQGQGMVAPPQEESRRTERPSGMLGFLSRKKGRDRSPKPMKEKERGVLGKEGARVVISHG
jgi:serine/threonine kinase 32